jgi:hypothetical protein
LSDVPKKVQFSFPYIGNTLIPATIKENFLCCQVISPEANFFGDMTDKICYESATQEIIPFIGFFLLYTVRTQRRDSHL